MALPVWLYWEGDCPGWIEACRGTIRHHASEVRLLGPDDFDRLWQVDRDLDLSRLCVAHRADFIRAYLLAHHGGLWVDSDCVVVRPLGELIENLERFDFLGYKERQGHVANNFMGARAGSPIAGAYYDRVVRLLRSGEPISWLTLGSDSLTATLEKSELAWERLGLELIQPICWSNPSAFFATEDRATHDRNFNERSLCYMLSNNMIQGHQAKHPECDLTASETFFTYLLERASGRVASPSAARRSSVGTSNWQQIPFCIEAMLDIGPMRVLDVGIGFGRWGCLVREFCEEWKGRTHRENWRVQLEGIEIFPKNVEEYHHLFYNWVHVGDGAEILAGMRERWDLILFGDVLEHWPKATAVRVLEMALDKASYVLVNIPIGPGWERGPMYDNPHEEHKSSWDLAEFEALKPIRQAVFNECFGRDYGTFLLSREDPCRLSNG